MTGTLHLLNLSISRDSSVAMAFGNMVYCFSLFQAPTVVEESPTADLSLLEPKEEATPTPGATDEDFWSNKFAQWREMFAARRASGGRRLI